MTTPLAERHCTPCTGGETPLAGDSLASHLAQVHERWQVEDGHHIEAEFQFANFLEALDFTNRIGAIAEQEGHHPDICLGWGRVAVTISTHAIDGLSDNDFILAAKIDEEAD
jgi:4a-hydroxytetrahydrobiopterin dehydratase